jgi:site-specific recombinase XerD
MTHAILPSSADRNLFHVQAFDKFLLIQGLAANSRTRYRGVALRFVKFLGVKSLLDVRPSDISGFYVVLHNLGLGSSSIASAQFSIRKLFSFLHAGGLVTDRPDRRFRSRKQRRRLPRALAEEEIAKLFAAATSLRNLALLEFIYATGCRESEASNMNVENIDFEARSASVLRGKQGDRTVLFGRPAEDALKKYLAGRTSGPLFLSNSGNRLGTRDIHRIVGQTALLANLGHVAPHELRHSFATHCLNHGMNLRALQLLLGHANLSQTCVYLHSTPTELIRVHRQFFPGS